MSRLLRRIEAGEILVSDGAMGSQLFARGLPRGTCPELWNLERPEVLESIHREYREAGADFAHANTFGATPIKLEVRGLRDRCAEINRAALRLARAGAGKEAILSASLGPTGRTLLPFGDLDPGEAAETFREQVAILLEEGLDAFSVETMTDLEEARLVVRACKELAPEIPVLATMTFDRSPRGWFTIMGVDPASAAEGLAEAGADLVGSNCGNGAEAMVKVAAALAEASDLPLIIQPNAGLPRLDGGDLVYDEDSAFMAEQAARLLDLGVRVVGGCCGTTPEHIRALRELVDRRSAL